MYNHFVQTFIDAQTAAWRHYSAVAATEKRLFADMSAPAVRVPHTGEVIAELRRTYEALADRIITKARQQFGKGGARPVVNRTAIFLKADFDIEESLTLGDVPDFDRLWSVLEMELGRIGSGLGEAQ